jgi:hypothetical protein
VVGISAPPPPNYLYPLCNSLHQARIQGFWKGGGGGHFEGVAWNCERQRREAPDGGLGPPPGKVLKINTLDAISWHLTTRSSIYKNSRCLVQFFGGLAKNRDPRLYIQSLQGINFQISNSLFPASKIYGAHVGFSWAKSEPSGPFVAHVVGQLVAQMGDSQISQFAQMGVTWVSTVQKPYGAHMGEVGPIFPRCCPDGDHNLTMMAQLPPIWAPYVLLAGHGRISATISFRGYPLTFKLAEIPNQCNSHQLLLHFYCKTPLASSRPHLHSFIEI